MNDESRRRFLALSASASFAGLAGCGGASRDVPISERPEDWCLDELSDEVPAGLETAESIDGLVRDPDDVASKEEAAYKCGPQGGMLCANCTFFVQPAEPDEFGACTVVEGEIRSQDWCGLYRVTERLDEPPDPDPIGRD